MCADLHRVAEQTRTSSTQNNSRDSVVTSVPQSKPQTVTTQARLDALADAETLRLAARHHAIDTSRSGYCRLIDSAVCCTCDDCLRDEYFPFRAEIAGHAALHAVPGLRG